MKFEVIVIVSFLGFLSLFFQNCSKSNFEPVSADSYFKAESVVDPADDQIADVVAIQPVASSTVSTDDMVTTTDVVECELLGQNQKIVLASDLAVDSSNNESSRVCMSGYACVKLLNAYAAEHNCSLDRGPASSPGSQAVCAKKFPGSQGVCANARMISDSEVEKILEAMGK
jgi:hypothetical protein